VRIDRHLRWRYRRAGRPHQYMGGRAQAAITPRAAPAQAARIRTLKRRLMMAGIPQEPLRRASGEQPLRCSEGLEFEIDTGP